MNFKQYKQLESYYFDIELGLFKSNKTFIEFLKDVLNDDDYFEAINDTCKAHKVKQISKANLRAFINDINIDSDKNDSNKNILVKHNIGDNYEVLGYALKPTQSYSKHEAVATRYIMNNYKVIKGNIKKVILGGLLSVTDNTRVYLYINDN